MLSPYDLGRNSLVAENCQKINIDDLVTEALRGLKIRLVESQIQALGVDVNLTISRTKFNGKRLWFICPNCKKRAGVLRKHPIDGTVGCRSCLNLKYKKQRFKGMLESLI